MTKIPLTQHHKYTLSAYKNCKEIWPFLLIQLLRRTTGPRKGFIVKDLSVSKRALQSRKLAGLGQETQESSYCARKALCT
ncbi:hypothetical protein CDL12_04979 [Handroanthus impetiginosus]|uniref:Uncharacterized protein n=1 Tax=Handroanthus impetiginosus TaxID=429701 RepID=A0A2G9HXS1_9LAMI|nr:hypothetical protein CDL12_04979 [Handroanthus impetiginosus]